MYQIGNFQPFRTTQTIRFKPINLIYGRNSSGKSAIIRSLALLHHIASGGDPDAREIVVDDHRLKLGGFDHYVHQGNLDWQVEFCVCPNSFPTLADDSSRRAHELLSRLRRSTKAEAKTQPKQSADDKLGPPSDAEEYPQDGGGRAGSGVALGERLFENSSVRICFALGLDPLWRAHYDGRTLTNSEAQGFEVTPRITLRRIDVYCDGSLLLQYTDENEDAQGEQGPFALRYVDAEHPHLYRHLREKGFEKSEILDLSERAKMGFFERDCFHEGLDENTGISMLRRGVGLSVSSWPHDKGVAESSERLRNLFNEFLAYCGAVDKELIIPCVNQKRVADLQYLGPWRNLPDRRIMGGDSPLGCSEDSLTAGQDPWQSLRLDGGVRTDVNKWLNETSRLSSPYVFEVVNHSVTPVPNTAQAALVSPYRNTELVLVDKRTKTPVSLHDVGTGIGQVMPVIVHLLGMKRGLLCIEQPELHLHPGMQAEIGDAILQSALHRGNCVIAETHSEHLLLRIMRRMRETANGSRSESERPVTPDDVGVFYVDTAEDCSFVRELELTESGELVQDWPHGFFDDGLREVLM